MLLLVVLSMLALFALIGVTFVLIAGQHRRALRAESRVEQHGDDYRKQLDSVFAQIVRDVAPQPVAGTQSTAISSIAYHSLLNDMYGTDGVKGTVSTAYFVSSTASPSGPTQLIDLQCTALSNLLNPALGPSGYYQFPTLTPTATVPAQVQTPGYFNGCVLTMIDGPAANYSTRIVGWGYNSGTFIYTIRILAFDGYNAYNSGEATVPAITGNFVINGRPFNGTGFGFNTNVTGAGQTLLGARTATATITPCCPTPGTFSRTARTRFSAASVGRTKTTTPGICRTCCWPRCRSIRRSPLRPRSPLRCTGPI